MRLLDFLFPPREDELVLREVDSGAFLEKLRPALVEETAPATTVLLSFGDPAVRSAVHEAKYHGTDESFALLSGALAEYFEGDAPLGPSVIVPIPLSKERKKARGFNQIEEIVRRAELGIPIESRLLVRLRDTASQVSLPRAKRAENMRGAFGAAYPASADTTYIVIDDVITTGATLQAAIDALSAAGAVRILPLALAH